MQKQKFDVGGNDILYYETMHVIENAVNELQTNVVNLVSDSDFSHLDNVLKGIEMLHAMAGNLMAFVRYKAFTFDVVSTSDTSKKSEV